MFELRVVLCGLCVYDTTTPGEVSVYMPDCRRTHANPNHDDGCKGEAHIGYMRADYGSIDGNVAAPTSDIYLQPAYELIHRFDSQQLDFNLPAAPMTVALALPSMREIAPALSLVPGIAAAAPKALLFRTVLRGGRLQGAAGGKTWEIEDTLNPGTKPTGQWAGWVTWTRSIDAANLQLTVSSLNGTSPYRLTLNPVATPTGPAVTLKLGNLCSNNPLEWRDLETNMVSEDRDFKWLYRLFQPPAGLTYSDILMGAQFPFPATKPGTQPFGAEDCIGVQVP
jgi:hypothetical protein